MKRILCIVLTVFAMIQAIDAKPRCANRAEAIAAQMRDPHSKYVVVACHRGDWRNFPENSIPAIESVIRMGADVMELDLKMTKDSVLVLSHDKDVLRCTNFRKVFAAERKQGKSAKIKDLTYEEIQRLCLNRAHGVATDTVKMPTLRQALAVCKDRICVNVDQGYEYYDQVVAIAAELGVVGQILIKSSKTPEEVAAKEAGYKENLMYMPIIDIQSIKGKALYDRYKEKGIVPMAYEVCWKKSDGSFEKVAAEILASGSKVWVNTIWASLCGGIGHDDDEAYMHSNKGDVYDFYLKNGVSMIQTDRPVQLIKYLKSKGRHTLKY